MVIEVNMACISGDFLILSDFSIFLASVDVFILVFIRLWGQGKKRILDNSLKQRDINREESGKLRDYIKWKGFVILL